MPFVLSLLGVGTLMILYIIFVGKFFGVGNLTDSEKFAGFTEYAKSVSADIVKLSELDNAVFTGSEDTFTITNKGAEQELRDSVFKNGAYKAVSYVSETTGNRCAMFTYSWYDLECVVIYDKGHASGHITTGSEFAVVINDDLAAAAVGKEIR